MAIREICKYPDPVLRKKAAPVKSVDDDLRRLVEDMVETMYAEPGVGLAAPQIGVSLRLLVTDITVGEKPDSLIVLVNPTIVSASGRVIDEEGCLSIPGIRAEIRELRQWKFAAGTWSSMKSVSRGVATWPEPFSMKWTISTAFSSGTA